MLPDWTEQLRDGPGVEPELQVAEDRHEAVSEAAGQDRGRQLEGCRHGIEASAPAEPGHVPDQ